MSGVQRANGVVVPAELCPAMSKLLRLGLAEARARGAHVPQHLRDAVDAISTVGAEHAMSHTRQGISRSDDMAGSLNRKPLGCREVAELLRVDARTVQRLAADGRLRGTRIQGKTWTFERTDVDDYQRNA